MDFTEWLPPPASSPSPAEFPASDGAEKDRGKDELLALARAGSLPPTQPPASASPKDEAEHKKHRAKSPTPDAHRRDKTASTHARSPAEPHRSREKAKSPKKDRDSHHRHEHSRYHERQHEEQCTAPAEHMQQRAQQQRADRELVLSTIPVEVPPDPPRRSSVSERDNICAICLSPFEEKMKLECGHSFCTKCILTWLATKPNCPTCRFTFGPQEIAQVAPNSNLQGATARDFTLLPHLGPPIGSPNTMYVWCVCWRRLVVTDTGITQCACGHQIDPQTVRAYNRVVFEGEYPVFMRESCGPDTADYCGCTSYNYQSTRAAYTGIWSVCAILCLLGPTTALCAAGQCCYHKLFATAMGICLFATGAGATASSVLICAAACAECCCFADRTSRLRVRHWSRDKCCLLCCYPTDRCCSCVGRDCLMRCFICERQSMRQIWVVPRE